MTRTLLGISLLLLAAGCDDGSKTNTDTSAINTTGFEGDEDGDKYTPSMGDCDEADANVNPGVVEMCDGIDNNCDGQTDEGVMTTYYADADLDGFGDLNVSEDACEAPTGYVATNTDCDDTNNIMFPGNPEVCDHYDNDCNTIIDDGVGTVYYPDGDLDGYGDAANPVTECEQPANYVLDSQDCDDTSNKVYPGNTEVCDLLDNDCNGQVDEGVQTTYYADVDGDGFGDAAMPTGACSLPTGYSADDTDCQDDPLAGGYDIHPGATEVCNAVDDNCDGFIDEDTAADASDWYEDSDVDGYGNALVTIHQCYQPPGYVSDNTDCLDTRFESNPGALEYCNTFDDDCDGTVDENDAVDSLTWYYDADGDNYGDSTRSTMACYQPADYVSDSTDCDDLRALSNPGATEYCNGEDDNCDGTVDESTAADASTWYADTDADTYGDPAVSQRACYLPAGYVADMTDCDDARFETNPGADEYCNLIDDDCNTIVDDTYALDASTWYADTDADLYGNAAVSTPSCTQPAGYVADATDCDDTRAATNPGADEYCNLIDDDCNLIVDDTYALDASTWYADTDADLYGNASVSTPSCTQPAGYVADATDCNDATNMAYPGRDEICDGIDNDCDTYVDEDGGVSDGNTYYADVDVDMFGDAGSTILACTQPSGYVDNYYDCNDGDATEPVAVDDAGTAGGAGTYADPLDTIAAGVAQANECVVVYAGSYVEYDIDAGKTIDIWGVDGYETTFVDPGLVTCDYTNPSACHTVFEIASGGGAAPTIHGFSVSGGTGMMSTSSTSATCADSSPSDGGTETCTVTTYTMSGGGAYINGDDPQFSEMVFSANTLPEADQVTTGSWTQTWVESMGGGVYAENSNATFDNVVFASNYADDGGGLYNGGGSVLTVSHAMFDDNTALDGAAVESSDGDLTVTNSVVQCNAATTDGGAFFGETGGDAIFRNVVVAYNTAGTAATNGSQTYSNAATSITLWNMVAQANTASPMFYNAGTASIGYSDAKNSGAGGTTSGPWTATSVSGNGTQYASISCDGDWTNDDATLRAGVAAIDAGDSTATYNDDDGTRNDMGAFGGTDGSAVSIWN